jgi:hypothetical protein
MSASVDRLAAHDFDLRRKWLLDNGFLEVASSDRHHVYGRSGFEVVRMVRVGGISGRTIRVFVPEWVAYAISLLQGGYGYVRPQSARNKLLHRFLNAASRDADLRAAFLCVAKMPMTVRTHGATIQTTARMPERSEAARAFAIAALGQQQTEIAELEPRVVEKPLDRQSKLL